MALPRAGRALFSAFRLSGQLQRSGCVQSAAQCRRARRRLHFLRLRAFLCDALLLAPDAKPRDERLPRAPRAARDHLSDRLPHGAILPAFQHSRHVLTRRGGLSPTAPQFLECHRRGHGQRHARSRLFLLLRRAVHDDDGADPRRARLLFRRQYPRSGDGISAAQLCGQLPLRLQRTRRRYARFSLPAPLYVPQGRHRLDRDLRERLVLCDRLRARAPLFHDPRRLRARGTCHRPHRAAPLPHAQERDDRLDGRLPVGDAHLQVRRGVLYRRCPRAVPLLFPLRPVPFERQRFPARHDPLHGGSRTCGLLCRRNARQKELPRLPRGRKGRGHCFARSCAARRHDELRPHGL